MKPDIETPNETGNETRQMKPFGTTAGNEADLCAAKCLESFEDFSDCTYVLVLYKLNKQVS